MVDVSPKSLPRVASRLGFGTGSLHHRVSRRQRQRLLSSAAEIGISHFDTAPYYGYGLAELDLGNFLSENGRARFTIATKIGLYGGVRVVSSGYEVWLRKSFEKALTSRKQELIDWSLHRAQESLKTSLLSLKTDYVDFLFLHEPNPSLIALDEWQKWLELEQSRGRVRHWGIAGENSAIASCLKLEFFSSAYIQTRKNVENEETAPFDSYGRSPDFTFGHNRRPASAKKSISSRATYQRALNNHKDGVVLVGATKTSHIFEWRELTW